MIINNYADCAEDEHECMSSEEMRAAFENFNDCDEKVREGCKIISMDVKALYPSMKWDAIVIAVKEMIIKSEMDIADVVQWQFTDQNLLFNLQNLQKTINN